MIEGREESADSWNGQRYGQALGNKAGRAPGTPIDVMILFLQKVKMLRLNSM